MGHSTTIFKPLFLLLMITFLAYFFLVVSVFSPIFFSVITTFFWSVQSLSSRPSSETNEIVLLYRLRFLVDNPFVVVGEVWCCFTPQMLCLCLIFFFFSNYKFQLFLNFDFRFVLKDFIGIIDRAKVFSLN